MSLGQGARRESVGSHATAPLSVPRPGGAGFVSVDQQIERKASPDDAWIFHTHDGAVTHARWIGEVHGETLDLVKLNR